MGGRFRRIIKKDDFLSYRGVNYQALLIFRREFTIRPEYIISEEQTNPCMTSSKENKEGKNVFTMTVL